MFTALVQGDTLDKEHLEDLVDLVLERMYNLCLMKEFLVEEMIKAINLAEAFMMGDMRGELRWIASCDLAEMKKLARYWRQCMPQSVGNPWQCQMELDNAKDVIDVFPVISDSIHSF